MERGSDNDKGEEWRMKEVSRIIECAFEMIEENITESANWNLMYGLKLKFKKFKYNPKI